MSTFLKIYDEKSYLEVGLLDGYISIATDYNVEDGGYPAYTEVKLNKAEPACASSALLYRLLFFVVTFVELLDTTTSSYVTLLTSEEWMAFRANIHA